MVDTFAIYYHSGAVGVCTACSLAHMSRIIGIEEADGEGEGCRLIEYATKSDIRDARRSGHDYRTGSCRACDEGCDEGCDDE